VLQLLDNEDHRELRNEGKAPDESSRSGLALAGFGWLWLSTEERERERQSQRICFVLLTLGVVSFGRKEGRKEGFCQLAIVMLFS